MTTAWRSLFLPCEDNVAEALRSALTALGYELYDPFGLIPGKAYPQAVRLFVAPPRSGWTRVIGEPDPALLPALAPCLSVALDGADARIEFYGDPPDSYARCIEQARQQTASAPSAALGGVALDALPDDVQALAGRVDLRQAQAMFARLSGTLAPKGGGDLLRLPDWNSAGGAQIRSLLDCLNIPEWRAPDFVTLRDAYALSLRRRRTPNATLYPGDAEALAAVPDALAYTPVYAGKA